MPKLTITTDGGTYEFENDSVENVADLVAATVGTLNIAPNASAAVNGAPAQPTTPVADGDEVAFTKPAGRKGA